MLEVAEWKFQRGGWLQVYQLSECAGGGSCTLAVSDIDHVVAHVQSLGIDTSERTSGARVKTVMITDPDGNYLAFAEAIDQGNSALALPSKSNRGQLEVATLAPLGCDDITGELGGAKSP